MRHPKAPFHKSVRKVASITQTKKCIRQDGSTKSWPLGVECLKPGEPTWNSWTTAVRPELHLHDYGTHPCARDLKELFYSWPRGSRWRHLPTLRPSARSPAW